MSLTIIQRTTWNARRPSRGMDERPPSAIHELFIHWPGEADSFTHVNTAAEERSQMRAWQQFHMDVRGWSDIGYNFALFPNFGRPKQAPNIYVGRGLQFTPAAQLNHNTGTVAIVVAIGAHDHVTDDIARRLRSFHRWAEDRTGNKLRVRGHGEVFGTDCPGPQLRKLIHDGLQVK
jgi:hypothetical protein